jgi:hypothetical protein
VQTSAATTTDLANSLLNLVNWLGLVVMPIFGALMLAAGIYKYSKGESMERCVAGVGAAISISAIAALASTFMTSQANVAAASDSYSNALLNITNWVGNVILPTYAAFEVVRAAISFEDMTSMRTDLRPVKHFMTALMCCSVSAIMRLIEYFVAQGQQIGAN